MGSKKRRPAASNVIPFPAPRAFDHPLADEFEGLIGYDTFFDDSGPPTQENIDEENELMLMRWHSFRVAAEFVATRFAQLPMVEKVVLFGSAAVPLKKEVPRFNQFRRARQPVWHECGDVDLAVWVNDLEDLNRLRKATNGALSEALREFEVGVANHQVDVHLMEPGSDRYLGRLCHYNTCPKGKPACRVPGCGAKLFIQQFAKYAFRAESIEAGRIHVLFDRAAGAGIHGFESSKREFIEILLERTRRYALPGDDVPF